MTLWKNLSLLSLITLLTSLATLTCLQWTSTDQYRESLLEETIEVRNREYEGYQELSTTGDGSSRISIEQRTSETQTEAQLPTEQLISIIRISTGRLPDGTKHPEVSVKAPEDSETYKQPKSARGYALAEDYWEQQTLGSRNLQNLQCWAGQLNLSVVEPFIVNSVLQTPLSNNHDGKMFHFSDLFDLQTWNKFSENLRHSQLVSWEDFIQHAPRDVILVHFKYAYARSVQLLKQGLREYLPPSERYKTSCSPRWPKEVHTEFITSNHFKIVRRVCFNFEYGDRVLTQDFNDHIYGQYAPGDVTVIFRQWRSIGTSPRILLKDSKCHNTYIQEYIHPGRKLIQDAKTYQEAYLNGGRYIAIMARLERSVLLLQKKAGVVVKYCLEQTFGYWNRTTAVTPGMGSTFLSVDLGTHGSNSFHSNSSDAFEAFLNKLYGNMTTIAKWEKTFEDISQSKDSGYIALLQKTLVARADCVIFSGGGSFQKHALHLYQELHPKAKDRCITVVEECTGRGFFPRV